MLLVGSLSGGPAAVSENPLLVAESVLDYAMTCPLVFSAVLFVVFVLLSLVPACVSVHERLSTVNGPITIAKAISIVRASLTGKHMVTGRSPLRTTLSRTYSQDGALGVARLAADRAVSAFGQTWVHRLYRWISPSEEVVLFGVLFLPVTLYFGWVNFGSPACAYLSGLLAGIGNDSGLRTSSCDYVVASIYTPVDQLRRQDHRLQNLYCSGELSGFDTRTEWAAWMEHRLYSLEMFHLTLFVSLVALALLPTFIVWTVIRMKDLDYVIVRKSSLTAMKVAESPAPKKVKNASDENPARRNGTTGNRISVSQRTSIIDQLNGRIRELESCTLDSRSKITALEEKVRNKDRVLVKLLKDREELQLVNSKERSRREYLTEKLAKTVKKQDTLKLSSSLQLAREQLRQEEVRAGIAEDRYKALRVLAGRITTEPGLYMHLFDFDKIAEQCNVDGVNSTTRKIRLELMQQTLKNKLPYLLREATTKAYAVRNAKCDEQLAAIKKTAALERDLERARRQSSSLAPEPAKRPRIATPNDNMAMSANAELDAMRQQLAKAVADLEMQRGETAATIGLLEGARSAHTLAVAALDETHNTALITHSSLTQELEVKIQAARRHAEEVRAGKDKEIEKLRQELEAKNQEIVTHTHEIQETGRALAKMECELQEARRSYGALEVAAKASEFHDAETQTPVTGAELAQLQQQLVSTATREEALSTELAKVKGLLQRMELEHAQFQVREQNVKEGLIAQRQTALSNKDFEYKQQIDHLQSAGQALDAEYQQLRAKIQRQQATSTALANANARVVEQQAHINHLTQKLSQVSQAPTDDLTRQQIEKLRARVQVLEKGDRDNVADKVRFTQRIKSLEEELQKARIALSNAKADAVSPRPVRGPNPLRAKVDDLNKALQAKDAELSALQVQIETQQDKIKSQEDRLSHLVSLGWIQGDSSKGPEVPILETGTLIGSEVEVKKRAGEPLEPAQKRQRMEEYESSAILAAPAIWS
ncbi:hypothetical protein EMCG_07408 [[Emmonsia] crescens]|uniref:Uncharacterized protein n=1 Tax=[Emmonsia] crescens TaxID=73230 RepID=A0A0G2I8I6_9EURO|nr:hypothetical protein EMCG_07408 [Emmonsia crescens UAMH 3008]